MVDYEIIITFVKIFLHKKMVKPTDEEFKTIERVEKLRENHRELWFERNQAFGLDSIERRYGGVLIRLNTAIYRLKKYLSGEVVSIEELEEPRLPATRKSSHVAYTQGYGSIVSAFA